MVKIETERLFLREILSTNDQQVVDTFLKLKNGGVVDFEEMSQALFEWAGGLIRNGEH